MKRARATARAALGGGRLPALIGLIGLLILGAADPGPLETLRLKTFDQLQLRFPTEPAIGPVVIVDIDERSLAEVGQWPWPRTDLARLVANLRRLGAVVVGFDMVFAETDRMSAPEIAVRLPGLDDETRAKLSAMPGSDAVLADAMRAGRIVVGQGTLPIPQVHTEQVQHPPPILVGGDPAARLHGFPRRLAHRADTRSRSARSRHAGAGARARRDHPADAGGPQGWRRDRAQPCRRDVAGHNRGEELRHQIRGRRCARRRANRCERPCLAALVAP